MRFHLLQVARELAASSIQPRADDCDQAASRRTQVHMFLERARTTLVRAIIACRVLALRRSLVSDATNVPQQRSLHSQLAGCSASAVSPWAVWQLLSRPAVPSHVHSLPASPAAPSWIESRVLAVSATTNETFVVRAAEAAFLADVAEANSIAARYAVRLAAQWTADAASSAAVRVDMPGIAVLVVEFEHETCTWRCAALEWLVRLRSATGIASLQSAAPADSARTAIDSRSVMTLIDGTLHSKGLARGVAMFAGVCAGLVLELLHTSMPTHVPEVSLSAISSSGAHSVTFHVGIPGGRRVSFSVISDSMRCVAQYESHVGVQHTVIIVPVPDASDGHLVCDPRSLVLSHLPTA